MATRVASLFEVVEGSTFHLGGLGVTYRILSEKTQGTLAVLEHTLEAGFLGSPPHLHHHEDEFTYVLEGVLTVMNGEEVVELPANASLFKPRGCVHSFWNSGTTPARFYEVITPGGFETYFAELAQLMASGPDADPQDMDRLRKKYGLEYHLDRMAELLANYNLRLR